VTGEGVILFGGSGFLGPYILGGHPEMVSVGRTPPPTSNPHVQVDSLADLDAVHELEFDKVIYIVGHTDHHSMEREEIPRGEPTAFDYHVIPFLQTMEQLKQRPIKKLIQFSTSLVYDQNRISLPVAEDAPIDPYVNRYVLSKYLAEEAAKFYEQWVPIITVRMGNLYGPTPLKRYDLIHVLTHQLLDEGKGEVWSTKPARDFIYVEDAARAIVQLLDTDHTGIVNLGSGTMTPVRTIVDLLEQLSGAPVTDLGQPVSGPMEFRYDLTLLHSLIDWQPEYSIEDGVKRTFELMSSWKKEAA
jgi:nucleoside-diphosphate-sugar epimerase